MSVIFYYIKLNLFKCSCSVVWSLNFNLPKPSYMFHKSGFVKSCLSTEDLSVCTISWFRIDWCKFCIHLGSTDVRHFVMVEGTGFENMASRSPSLACLLNFIKSASWFKIYWRAGHGDRTEYHNPHFLSEENRLKKTLFFVQNHLRHFLSLKNMCYST
jgi:hypothetical protein